MTNPQIPSLDSLLSPADLAEIEKSITAQIACHKAGTPYNPPKRSTAKSPLPAPTPIPRPKPSSWNCTKAVLVLSELTCSQCASIYLAPAATGLLAHFAHKTDPSQSWEIAAHPSTLRDGLPKETRLIRTKVSICQHCLNGEIA